MNEIKHYGRENPYNGREDDFQRAAVRYLQIIPCRPLFFHVPNGGKRTAAEAAIFKALGVRPGVADLVILGQRQGYGGLFVELKARKGHLSTHQTNFLNEAAAQGYQTAVAWNLDAFRQLVNDNFNISNSPGNGRA